MNSGPDKDVVPSTGAEAGKVEGTLEKAPAGVWVAASAALAAVVAIFGTLGIEGDILRRMVRNHPADTAWSISLVIIGASVPLVLLLVRMTRRWVTVLVVVASIASAIFVVVGMTRVLWTGAESLNSRDMPGLSLTAVKSPSGAVTITSEATAPALRSWEKMLLRIYAVGPSESADLGTVCQSGEAPALKVPSTASRVLQWGESGPDRSGAAKVSDTLIINGGDFSFVCAYAALRLAPGEVVYFAWSVVDLRSLTFVPTESRPTASTSTAP